jgi:hypothetical protein
MTLLFLAEVRAVAFLQAMAEAAMTLIDESTHTDPWEHAVAACLRAWAHLATGCRSPNPVEHRGASRQPLRPSGSL